MKKLFTEKSLILTYILIFCVFLIVPLLGNHAVTVFSDAGIHRQTVIIDAGHGGVDGGAVSCTGVYESNINLEIALRLEDLMHLLGIKTVMIRTTDCSIHTEGNTIASKKVSDIKERVRIVNTTANAIFVSIHQNHYSDSRYSGAQVFYNSAPESKQIADVLQNSLRSNLDPENKRQCKKSSGVYLMAHINCPGVLIECGFLSNPDEEGRLRDFDYQKKLCCTITATLSQYLNT